MTNKATILLCEDEEFVARSYIRKLELEGFTVIHAKNGEQALEKIVSEKPDLVLLDLLMPLRSGFEVLRELEQHADATIKKIPILITSNLGQKADKEEALKLGAAEYIVKSDISLKELVEKVRKHLGNT